MNEQDKEKIKKIIRDRKHADDYLKERNSRTYRAFIDMEKAAFESGTLDKKFKEMIAIGISIAVNCESCMQWHIREALNAGATEEQVLEAIEVGMEMGGGPATVSSRFAISVLEYYTGKTSLSSSS
ncbi:MAG: carboxymuconolactone decarboxylase family protein [candidate division WOR-3 bacterium]|nr:MAG: carboxymuconolactone decarboxylase family protein [candidate division WOR-3 bacterium]